MGHESVSCTGLLELWTSSLFWCLIPALYSAESWDLWNTSMAIVLSHSASSLPTADGGIPSFRQPLVSAEPSWYQHIPEFSWGSSKTWFCQYLRECLSMGSCKCRSSQLWTSHHQALLQALCPSDLVLLQHSTAHLHSRLPSCLHGSFHTPNRKH